MSLNVSKTKFVYISSTHKQRTLANCDHDISICDSKIQVSSVENLRGVAIIILSAGMLTLITLFKSVILTYSYCQELKCFYLEGTEYCFTTLILYRILISVVLSRVIVDLHWKINL